MSVVSEGILCTSCFAPLPVKDQRGSIVRCEYCGTEHALSKEVKTVLAEDTQEFVVRLGYAIADAFSSLDEMRDLITALSGEKNVIPHRLYYDAIRGETVRIKAIELTMWAKRRTLLQDLVNVVIAMRPSIDLT